MPNARIATVLACILGACAGTCIAASPPQYVTKPIQSREIRFPVPTGFTPACEENDAIRERFALMAGANTLLTCLFESADYAELAAGRTPSISPLIVLGSVSGPAGELSADEFKQSVKMAHARMGDIVEDSSRRKKAQAQIDAADERVSTSDARVQRQLTGTHMRGFFDSTETSYSFLQSNGVNVTIGTDTYVRTELQAVTSLWVEGRLLVLFVSEDQDHPGAERRVRDITLQWLAAYRRANPRKP